MEIDISLIILSWNDRQHLIECLESLSGGRKSRAMEVIVVDNASTDGSPDMVESKFPEVKLIRNDTNVGFPKGNNIGVAASQGRYLCLLNSDIKVLNDCLEILADQLDEHPNIGMIGPRIFYSNMTHQSSCRKFPTIWNNVCSATGLSKLFRNSGFFSGEHMFYFQGDRACDVDVLVGCFWMVRRRALDQFGLLDEGFFMYGEDVDWCKRCWQAGWRVSFYPGAQAIHYGGGSSSKNGSAWVEMTQQRSILRYWNKHHGSLGMLGIGTVLMASRLIRWSGAAINYVFKPIQRPDSLSRLQTNWACMRDLFQNGSKQLFPK